MGYLTADFGSTWTKVAAIDGDGQLLGIASHPTTLATDVLDGWNFCRQTLRDQGIAVDALMPLACSSAGGGLRIAVIGNEELVTSEAGRRVSLSSGGHVVAVFSGGLQPDQLATLQQARPDLILLVGGTDGGNPATLLASATVLGKADLGIPVIVAGDCQASGSAATRLGATPCAVADNVVPAIGTFNPVPARNQVRDMFLRHVIGGKGLSASPDFAQMVRGATPDIVLRGVEVVADLIGDVVVVDVGGATTDVHSVVVAEVPEGADDVVGVSPATRTVEGDLGMRWSALTTVAAGREAGVLPDSQTDEGKRLDAWVASLTAEVLAGAETADLDDHIATTALAVALQRHAGFSEIAFLGGKRVVIQTGTDIREASLVIGSGGILRANPGHGGELLAEALQSASAPGRMLPRTPRIMVDAQYLLAPIGLLVEQNLAAARRLAENIAAAV